jgi:hypothetical protein
LLETPAWPVGAAVVASGGVGAVVGAAVPGVGEGAIGGLSGVGDDCAAATTGAPQIARSAAAERRMSRVIVMFLSLTIIW